MDSTVFLFMTSDNTCIIGCFQLKNENPMCEHPAHQVRGFVCAGTGTGSKNLLLIRAVFN